ncbi:cell division protein ZapA [Aestuariibacter halophilus]|uniref:Cell division protein ZapA n=1 Tax=Fluctibacter halophilus TaxID=226011 RepID=A0ABS8G8K9_9ALTE|nr:cell division protein ZapA [Aestuariibacter halophilus]MCC2616496.1 cell division protein ZapA [Aestuariibacter halophilus]
MQTIRLLGKPYRVRCPAGQEQALQRSAQLLNERLQQTQRKAGLTAREDIIMMTALNMCHQELSTDNDESSD